MISARIFSPRTNQIFLTFQFISNCFPQLFTFIDCKLKSLTNLYIYMHVHIYIFISTLKVLYNIFVSK